MNVEIKLRDPEFCNGCPMNDNTQDFCAFGYWEHADYVNNKSDMKVRPQECIDKNGE